MARNWLRTISKLKKFIADVGPLWPNSTKLSGYGTDGPYHCSDCKYLKSGFKDDDGNGRCDHPVVIADSEVKHDNARPIVNIEHGCCEFVDQKRDNEEKQDG